MLAFNRCMFFAAPSFAAHLFGSHKDKTGYRTWFWVMPPTLWGLWYAVHEKPMPFSAIVNLESPNPHQGYHDEMAIEVCQFVDLKDFFADSEET